MTTTTRIIKCRCAHAAQDAIYGKGLRLANLNKKGEAACTVCRRLDGVLQGKMCARKHPARAHSFQVGQNYYSH